MVAVPRKQPLVSICIPAFNSQDFILETLHSALGQTVTDIEIIISIDAPHPVPALKAFRGRRNITVFDQTERLGWVGNSNFVLSQARGAHFMLLPHDDLLAPTYLERCLAVLESECDCFAAYSDIESRNHLMKASEARGGTSERVQHVMRNLFNGFSYRAVMRCRPGDWARLRLLPNPPTDFCVDTTWILQQACFGELRRVPEALYLKRHPPTSVHARWGRIPPALLLEAWSVHCSQMGDIASSVIEDTTLVAELVAHRRDPRRVAEAPSYLKSACGETTQTNRWWRKPLRILRWLSTTGS